MLQDTGIPYYNFSNIRYAAPPVGNLRFAAPIPPQTVNRTVNDGQQSVICPQANPGNFKCCAYTILVELISAAWELIEEDFLEGVPLSVLINQTTAAANLSLASIPPPDPSTSEDCLFLDVFVPKSIFDCKSERNNGGKFFPSIA